jgi:tetratricopeptide (TPR) repeat protein
MKRERRSLQDHIRERQQSGFVGRLGQVSQYRENMGLPIEDGRRRFLFNIHGDAGLERYEEACSDLTQAIELDRDDASSISQRGEIFLLMGRREDALTDFSKATELDPSNDYYTSRSAEVNQLMSENGDR